MNGFYMYTEASSRKPGDKARLFSPVNPAAPVVLYLQFWYHMNGADMGTLSVYLSVNIYGHICQKSIWSKSGNQGNQWNLASSIINTQFSYQVLGFISGILLFQICFNS